MANCAAECKISSGCEQWCDNIGLAIVSLINEAHRTVFGIDPGSDNGTTHSADGVDG